MKTNTFTSIFTLVIFAFSLQAQTFVKHDATGSNDGSSWDNAYTNLDDALQSSAAGDQIWVAAGTYKPGGNTPSVDAYFSFPHDLELYGGFMGTESLFSERDWIANETILSGDHDGNDLINNFQDNRIDNSKHVMWLTDTVTTASVIDGFTFRNGHTEPETSSDDNRRGGGILTYGAPLIRNCYFTQNFGHFGGGLYPRGGSADGIVIENCRFENNRANNGGGLYLNPPSATVKDCTFTNNRTMSTGGAFYNRTSQGTTISNCTFTDNQSLNSRGGAIYNFASPSIISDCNFMDNKASSSSGGALQVRHTDDDFPPLDVIVSNCNFSGSEATYGGAVGCYDAKSIVNLNDCKFEFNNSFNVGGALSNAFGATTNITNCEFFSNDCGGSGGAVFSQNDSSMVNISHCLFQNNDSERGGAIAMSGSNEPESTTPLANLNIENTLIQFNSALEQGGGINISNANMNLTNVVMDLNYIVNPGSIGGAISLNTSDSIHTTFSILNSTIVNNSAELGAGISNWRQDAESSSILTLQNNIFSNPVGNNYEIEAGTPTVFSNGGNLSTDATMESILTETNDLNNSDPLFVDEDDFDYRLQDSSPCIDMGIAAGAPIEDIDGNPRINEVDMGAYENQDVVGVKDRLNEFGQLEIFPNPVQDDLNYTFENEWKGTINISITDAVGHVLLNKKINKNGQQLFEAIQVKELPTGLYILTISNSQLNSSRAFIKK